MNKIKKWKPEQIEKNIAFMLFNKFFNYSNCIKKDFV